MVVFLDMDRRATDRRATKREAEGGLPGKGSADLEGTRRVTALGYRVHDGLDGLEGRDDVALVLRCPPGH